MAASKKVPCVLPKIDSKFIPSTKLNEDTRSTIGYDFDFTRPSEFSHYNPLRDPHLKMYFNRPQMLKRLIRRKCISSDLRVLCQSEEEFKLYKQFLSDEALKNIKRKEAFEALEVAEEENVTNNNKKKHKTKSKKKMYGGGKMRRTISRARKVYLKMQEKKLRHKIKDLKELQRNFKADKIKTVVFKFIQKKLEFLKKKNQSSLAELMKMIGSYDTCKDPVKKGELSDRLKTLQLQRVKEAEKIRTLVELEVLWKKHGDYACKAHEDSLRILKCPSHQCTKEAQGALLLSYLTHNLLKPISQSKLNIKQEERAGSKVTLPPIHQPSSPRSSQTAKTKGGKGKKQPDWCQWVQRQQEQMNVQLKRERDSWHTQRHKLFDILWKDAPNEKAEWKRCGQVRREPQQQGQRHLPPFGNAAEQRAKARSLFFGKNLEWQ